MACHAVWQLRRIARHERATALPQMRPDFVSNSALLHGSPSSNRVLDDAQRDNYALA
jgi:hypothetical protein